MRRMAPARQSGGGGRWAWWCGRARQAWLLMAAPLRGGGGIWRCSPIRRLRRLCSSVVAGIGGRAATSCGMRACEDELWTSWLRGGRGSRVHAQIRRCRGSLWRASVCGRLAGARRIRPAVAIPWQRWSATALEGGVAAPHLVSARRVVLALLAVSAPVRFAGGGMTICGVVLPLFVVVGSGGRWRLRVRRGGEGGGGCCAA